MPESLGGRPSECLLWTPSFDPPNRLSPQKQLGAALGRAPRQHGMQCRAGVHGPAGGRICATLSQPCNQTLQVPPSSVWYVPANPQWKQAGAMGREHCFHWHVSTFNMLKIMSVTCSNFRLQYICTGFPAWKNERRCKIRCIIYGLAVTSAPSLKSAVLIRVGVSASLPRFTPIAHRRFPTPGLACNQNLVIQAEVYRERTPFLRLGIDPY